MRAAEARTWCRVDLAGGTLDIWPLGLLHPGARTVNLAVELAAVVRLAARERGYRVLQGTSVLAAESAAELAALEGAALFGTIAVELGLPPVEVSVRSDSPRGGGLGASSALAVATIAAGEALLGHEPSAPERRARLARDVEARLMHLPTGTQDHYPAMLGGVLEIGYRAGGERVRPLAVDLDRLGRSLVVAYSGESHFSADNNWRVIRRRLDGEAEVVESLDRVRDAAAAMPAPLERGDLAEVGRLMSREWAARRSLAEGVSTPRVEELLARGEAAGAWGGKVCGAGGGGSIAMLCPAERRDGVAAALAAGGARILPARPAESPLEVRIE